jgi:hypothetical protein
MHIVAKNLLRERVVDFKNAIANVYSTIDVRQFMTLAGVSR